MTAIVIVELAHIWDEILRDLEERLRITTEYPMDFLMPLPDKWPWEE